MHSRLTSPRPALELIASMAVSGVFVLTATQLGLAATLGAAILSLIFVGALASPVAFAIGVLVLSPIPSTEALVGITFPFGLDPLNLLAVIGLTAATVSGMPFPLRHNRALLFSLAAFFAVFAAGWWRSYGEDPSGDTLSLLAKPLVALAAALLVVQLLPRSRQRVVPLAMASMLVVVAVSIVLQRIGAYTTAHQEVRGVELGAKQFGGLMLDGNSAGALFGIFAVPVYLLVAALGYRRAAFGVLATAVPVLLITLSRSGIVGLGVGLLVAAVLDRRRLRGIRTLIGVTVFASVWASTAGRSYVAQLAEPLTRYSGDRNALSSGREAIWTQVVSFFDEDPRRWLVGGGLDSFRDFSLAGPLQHAFATHNTLLKLLTDGGLVLAAAAGLVVLGMWRLGSSNDAVGRALRVALVSFLAVGLTLDVDLLSRGAAWLWVLVALAASQRVEARAAATMRPAMESVSHDRSGARIRSRTAMDPT